LFLSRLITALILFPLTLLLIFAASSTVFNVIAAILLLAGALEWTKLMDWHHWLAQGLYVVFIFLFMLVAYSFKHTSVMFFVVASLWWCLVFIWVLQFPNSKPILGNPFILVLLGSQIFVPTWLALVLLHELPVYGHALVLYGLFIVWSADTGAYFSGKMFGKRKLCPEISPNKTLEGLSGGLLLVLLIALFAWWWLQVSYAALLPWLLLAAISALASINGDLLISMLKRRLGLKDCGHYLPGHGGLLDRIDSTLGALPIFWLGFWLLNHYHFLHFMK